jgi:hypothetical protein
MIGSLIKYGLFGCLMLMVGQIPIGRSTVGAAFTGQVIAAGHWGAEQIGERVHLPRFSELAPSLKRWWRGLPPPVASERRAVEKKRPQEVDADGVASADREALIQLLR